jgi:deoxyribodipyrimidine photo-lyase
LADGDPAANNGGWQWTAGVGTDAAPYFRIFNPILQSKKFDPKGDFIKKWVPELKDVPQATVHEPWTMPADLQEQVGCIIGKDYPTPIVDRTIVKDRVIDAFQISS